MIVFGGMAAVSAQQVPVAGGYADAPNDDPEVVSAAGYAVRAQGRKQGARLSLVAIEHAEVQVVAGLNYRLRLRVRIGGRPRNAVAVVYKNLRGRQSLTSWAVVDFGVKGGGDGSATALPYSTIEELARALSEAYATKSLGKLDAARPYAGKVKIELGHSLLEGEDVTRQFTTLAGAERWLRRQENVDGLPARAVKPLLECGKGVCRYDFDGGILHNQLYLQEITYGYRNGRPYIKTISLLDGD
jgi:hypothetical protein